MSALLEIDGLSKRFAVKQRGRAPSLLHAVDGVSFVIARGEALGLVGESGCGKSTLAQLIVRLADPSAGAIRFAGEDIARTAARSFAHHPARARLQMVFQDAGESLNPRHTAFDAIADPLRQLKRLGGAALRAEVEALAAQVNLPSELLGRFGHQLSGGQKARVGIARAIALKPELLVLDEPTSALDVSIQAVILKLLDRLRRELGLTYVFVSHDLNVVRMLCERVLVMYLGKVVESGKVAEVFDSPRHPYTRALIDAIPDASRRTERLRLTGEPASPIDPDPRACRFASRCPRAQARCRSEMPELAPGSSPHRAACHFPLG
jgi:oligopeptide/dipeptide ABC transporter ATP-binding protein